MSQYKKTYKCPSVCPSWLPEKKSQFFSGNTNKSTFMLTNSSIVTRATTNSKYAHNSKRVVSNLTLNEFGRISGSNGGYGSPLKNTF
jgi:hypothetical protein